MLQMSELRSPFIPTFPVTCWVAPGDVSLAFQTVSHIKHTSGSLGLVRSPRWASAQEAGGPLGHTFLQPQFYSVVSETILFPPCRFSQGSLLHFFDIFGKMSASQWPYLTISPNTYSLAVPVSLILLYSFCLALKVY